MLGFGRARAIPRSQELVFLDADDDLGTIRSKLESSTAEEVYLVVPRRSPVLRTPLEFRILARIANELSSETIIVTDDGNRRRLAHAEGFRTRRSLRTLRHLLIGPDEQPPSFVVPDWVPIPSLSVLAGTLGVLALAAAAVLVAVPEMRVTLVPQSTQVTQTLTVTVDPASRAADPSTGTLPGEVLTTRVDVAGSVPIPPDRVVGKDRARGDVVMVNDRGEPAVVPRGTQVMVEGGPRFATDQEVRLSPSIPVRVGITASDPGSGGNVPAGSITAFATAGMDGLRVVNQRPTAGGTDRQAKVVLEDDLTRLRAQLARQARDQALLQLRGIAGPERTLPEQSLQVRQEGERFDQAPGTETEQLTGRMSATASATVFRNLAFNDLVGQMLVRGAGPGMRLSGRPTIPPPAVLGVEGNKVRLRTQASGVAQRELDGAQIAQELRGRSVREAQAELDRLDGLARRARVEIRPSWAPRAFRVSVTVEGSK